MSSVTLEQYVVVTDQNYVLQESEIGVISGSTC
jgi:hypothetical protein